MDQDKIGLFIRELRINKNMTQADLANKLNVTIQAVSKWERGKGLPDISLLIELSKIFNVSISEILNGESITEKNSEFEIDTLSEYFKKDKEQLIIKFINFVCFIIVFICSITLFIYNVKSIYYHYRTYKVETKSKLFLDDIYESINKDIELINNNQGNYSDEEYHYILSMIDEYQSKYLNYEKDKKILNKDSYKINDIEEYIKDIKNYNIENQELTKILINHNCYNYFYYNKQPNDKYEVNNYYFINRVFEYDKLSIEEMKYIIDDVINFYIEKYMYFSITLNYIIEAGDINE